MVVTPDFGHWLAGLIDGEGSFDIRPPSKGRSAPGCRFAVVLRSDDEHTLRMVADRTGLGRVRVHHRGNGAGINPQTVWRVESKAECLALVALLDVYPLRTRKAADYAVWRQAVLFWQSVQHRAWHPQDHTVMLGLGQQIKEARRFKVVGG